MNYQEIIREGKLYYPAWKHHSTHGNNINVVCDRCSADNLNICIGYNKMDLCMRCSQIVANSNKNYKEPVIQNQINIHDYFFDY
jgi:hypothetical protein